MTATSVRIRPVRLGEMHAARRDGADGAIYVRTLEPLGDYPRCLTDVLDHRADTSPDRFDVVSNIETEDLNPARLRSQQGTD